VSFCTFGGPFGLLSGLYSGREEQKRRRRSRAEEQSRPVYNGVEEKTVKSG